MLQAEGRDILKHAAEYQSRQWTEHKDFDAYRAYMMLLWLLASPEEHDDSIV